MDPSERRDEILRTLCRRRFDTIENLATEFCVSKRTVQRDIQHLMCKAPIITVQGKHGGVHMMTNYYPDRMYMKEEEICVLMKIEMIFIRLGIELTSDEKTIFHNIIVQYTKPKFEMNIKQRNTK